MAITISIDLTGILEGILLDQKGVKKSESIKALRSLLDDLGVLNQKKTTQKPEKIPKKKAVLIQSTKTAPLREKKRLPRKENIKLPKVATKTKRS